VGRVHALHGLIGVQGRVPGRGAVCARGRWNRLLEEGQQ